MRLYYRFRPASELALKELLYGELFFASTRECNDPFDSNAFAMFANSPERWRALLETALGSVVSVVGEDGVSRVAEALADRGDVSLSEFRDAGILDEALSSALAGTPESHAVGVIGPIVTNFIDLYTPPDQYFVSYSTINDHPLLWSHYGGRHAGYCLAIRAVDGSLGVDPARPMPPVIVRETPVIGNTMSFSRPTSFRFDQVKYVRRVVPADAFTFYLVGTLGKHLSEEERAQIRAAIERQFLEKHQAWDYEDEARLTLSAPTPWLAGGRCELTPEERLFHFNSDQLAGVIVGARASSDAVRRIIDIVRRNRQLSRREGAGDRTWTDLVISQAILSHHDRIVDIRPLVILSADKELTPSAPDFQRLLQSWQDGWGWKLSDGKASRTKLE